MILIDRMVLYLSLYFSYNYKNGHWYFFWSTDEIMCEMVMCVLLFSLRKPLWFPVTKLKYKKVKNHPFLGI